MTALRLLDAWDLAAPMLTRVALLLVIVAGLAWLMRPRGRG
jgi:hypothetical protein